MPSPIDHLFPRRYNSLRLLGFDYSAEHPLYFVTLDTQPYRPVFADFRLAKQTLSALLNPVTQNRLHLVVYTLMPDHFHMVASGAGGASLSSALDSFKGFTTSQYWKRGREVVEARFPNEREEISAQNDKEHILAALMEWRVTLRPEAVQLRNWPAVKQQFFLSKRLWKKSFFDHIIRNDQDLRETIEYIIMNSVRRGYGSKPQYYPFTGFGPYE